MSDTVLIAIIGVVGSIILAYMSRQMKRAADKTEEVKKTLEVSNEIASDNRDRDSKKLDGIAKDSKEAVKIADLSHNLLNHESLVRAHDHMLLARRMYAISMRVEGAEVQEEDRKIMVAAEQSYKEALARQKISDAKVSDSGV